MESNIKNERKADYKINDLFINRWSPRAMSGEIISDDDLMSLFEAARWAPSSYNEQPWRFVYAKKGTEGWDNIFSTLVDFNKSWAINSSHLIVIVSKDFYDKNKNFYYNSYFDTGSAWQNLALQGSLKNLVVHAMGGFDKDKLSIIINLPKDHSIQAVIAIGKKGNLENLSSDLQNIEQISDRKKINEFIFENNFKVE